MEVLVIYEKNPFIADYSAKLLVTAQSSSLGAALFPAKTAINNGSIIIDGIARFIVERIKKELQAAFFERLYTFIKKDEYRDCRTLFPSTYQTLLSIGDQIYNYESYLTSLRNAFGRDLEIILPNLEVVIRDGRFARFFNTHRELRSICLTALFVTKALKNGDHIGTVLENFPASDPDYIPINGTNEENLSIVRTIQFVQEFSKSLKSSTPAVNRYWVSNDVLRELADETTLKLYLGLLYERVKDISFGTGAEENFGQVFKKAKSKLDQLKQLVIFTADNITECENKFSELRSDRKVENYIAYFNSISNLLNGIRNAQPFKELNLLPTSPLPDAIQAKIDMAWELLDKANFAIDNAMNIYTHSKSKNYSLVLSDVRSIYKQRFASDKIDNGNNDKRKQIEAIFDFLTQYVAALAEMAEAKDSKEVYAVIDRIAAPVGSSRVKKENVFSLSFNAYGGAFIGKESIENVKDKSSVNNYGISAPVGLAFSFGKIKYNKSNAGKGNKCITLFISIIDLGAPVSFRFQNDTLDEIPNISFKEIISPGAHLIYGFGKVPISLSFGWQTGPNLRKVTSQYNEYSNSKYSRFALGLYVDIPVFILARRKYW